LDHLTQLFVPYKIESVPNNDKEVTSMSRKGESYNTIMYHCPGPRTEDRKI
jgi:3-methyladenine DNA glycosylase Tag